jgi:acid phosphatase (class A)
MVPEKRAELFARGWEFGQNRVVGGVHYPTDVEAGRIDATVLVYAMMQNPQYKSDFAAAKTELRTALGLAP